MPVLDDEVWIEFEAGISFCPIWVGCFWDEEQVSKDEAEITASNPSSAA